MRRLLVALLMILALISVPAISASAQSPDAFDNFQTISLNANHAMASVAIAAEALTDTDPTNDAEAMSSIKDTTLEFRQLLIATPMHICYAEYWSYLYLTFTNINDGVTYGEAGDFDTADSVMQFAANLYRAAVAVEPIAGRECSNA